MIMVILAGPQGFTGPRLDSPSISQAIDELLRVKTAANLRPLYLKSLRQYLNQFAAGRSDRPIDEFTVDDLERWFTDRNESPSTRASNLGRLSSLFAFSERRRWILENPCRFVEPVRLEAAVPRILSVDEADQIVRHCRKHERKIFAYVALGLFAGIRPYELHRLDWSVVDLVNGRVRLDANVTKVRRMRWVELPANCVAWLNEMPASERRGRVSVSHTQRRRAMRRLRKAMGWKEWPQDVLRHTAASNLIAIREDVAKVALQLGTSAKILLSRYHQLVWRSDAETFFSIAPGQ